MALRFDKKVRKYRGGRTYGYGRVGQHRKSGMKGGKGFAGMKKHGKSWILAHMPDYFGKRGFKAPSTMTGRVKPITLRELDYLVKRLGVDSNSKTKLPTINLKDHGYNKLLSTGYLSTPLEVIVEKATAKAISKVEAIGGKVVLAGES
ncbi:MAG: 50S ribosomal protein L15 [Candidatus Odinarchaeum yellowstonii]|jgi:large subunit ribosomal protein L15|uniref:Large ribosomal subunit protein uL15 n=1 Tax=Odinarchaeota yellowstonii (strain LCB_4) TaxID=1841599 RepID=A0AAF0D1E6_ODILC|nr:MAG: 50S ribosomal protein L15 [Candidatus Odinarchaeum yellowstonii]